MICKVQEKVGHAVAVIFSRAGEYQGRVLTAPEILRLPIGAKVDIPEEQLDRGAEYGLDFEVVLWDRGNLTLTLKQINHVLHAHGIWTYEDLVGKPNEVRAACASLAGIVHGELLTAAKNALGG